MFVINWVEEEGFSSSSDVSVSMRMRESSFLASDIYEEEGSRIVVFD